MKDSERPAPDEVLPDHLSRSLSRRRFVAGAATVTSLAALLAACGDSDDDGGDATSAAPTSEAAAPPSSSAAAPETTEAAPESTEAAPESTEAPPESSTPTATIEPLKQGLAPGMYGGPVGFEGAERYQYPLDSEEGRAIEGLRKLRQDGKAPDKLIIQVLDFAQPQFEKGFPQGAQSHLELFEEETGIKVEFVVTSPADEYPENLRNASTQNGSFDLVTTAIEEVGDFAEAGLLLPLDEFVAKYQPQWADPEWGYLGGEPTVSLFNQYKGSTYTVAFDNDTQPWTYRADLMENPDEMAAFADKYGRPLAVPETWEQQAEVAEFFTRPDQNLFGDVCTLAPFWCAVNWNQRFVSSANPNMMYFNADASANVNNEAGVRAFAELLKSAEWHEPGFLEHTWIEQYGVMGAGNGFSGGSFPNQTKIVPGNPDIDKANVGQYYKTAVCPGRIIDGALIRRPVIFYNICYGVNAFSDPAHHEAAYLFLQWAGGARAYTWLTANPAGYQDPHHIYTLKDPLVAESYKPQPLEMFGEIVPRTAPPITLKGGGAYRDSLSEEIQKVLTKQSSPEAAAKSLQDRWDKITDDVGADVQVEALKTFTAAYPTVVDTPTA
jgi:multiple sugar transport system substrate-binding protein